MTDLEMTKLCAEAMGYHTLISDNRIPLAAWPNAESQNGFEYDPLHDDAQAMALVKELRLHVCTMQDGWGIWPEGGDHNLSFVRNNNLNAAIVECVAKLKGAKL